MIANPKQGCVDLRFVRAVHLSPSGEVALEDYARVSTRAEHAETIPDSGHPTSIAGVHVCAPPAPLAPATCQDIETFAREMEVPGEGGGLGWS